MAPVLLKGWTKDQQVKTLCAVLWITFGVVAFGVTVYAFYRAKTAQLIGGMHVGVAAIALAIIEGAFFLNGEWLPWHFATGAMIWTVVSVGISLGPLAIHANRHR